MSLISRAKHKVTVIDREEGTDGDGAVTPVESPPIVVDGNVHPVSADEAEAYGLKLTDSYRVTVPAGIWPGSPHALVVWDGDTYSQVGRVLKSRMGHGTRHDRVFIRRGQDG